MDGLQAAAAYQQLYGSTESDMSEGATRIWDALIGTDPKHTSTFKRAGGFQGTALRPMWAVKHMTEQFGPIGVGWGFEESEQKIIEAGDEMLVYSKASVWYADGKQIAHTPGQWGGDKIAAKRKDGSIQTDDEAPKKALTDAALKCLSYIGLGADIHLGQFEDSKYVQQVNQQYREQEAAERYADDAQTLRGAKTLEELKNAWGNLSKEARTALQSVKEERKAELDKENAA